MFLFYHHIKKKKLVSLMTAVLGLVDLFRLNFLIQVQTEERLCCLEKSMESFETRFFPRVCINTIPNKIFNVGIF